MLANFESHAELQQGRRRVGRTVAATDPLSSHLLKRSIDSFSMYMSRGSLSAIVAHLRECLETVAEERLMRS